MLIGVTGGRKYGWMFDEENHEVENTLETWFLYDVLETFREKYPTMELMHGGAKGADSWAHHWAVNKNIKTRVFKAEWNIYGKAAGVIRNTEMVWQKPDIVIAFPGGTGTADMIKQSLKAELKVIQVDPNNIEEFKCLKI